jgi:hypothetical protein
VTIIALSGYATSGKDSVADILVEDYGFVKYAWADSLRAAAAALNPIVDYGTNGEFIRYNDVVAQYGYNEAKAMFPEVRNVLQRIGTEVGRNIIGDNVWVDATFKQIADERSLTDNIVISDTRFPNEAYAVQARSESKNYVGRVNRPGVGPVTDHPSETSLDDFDFDFVIDNDGTLDDLRDQVGELYKSLENLR